VASAIVLLVALGLFPGITLRPISGSETPTKVAALVAFAAGILVGLVLLGYSYRGFEEMTLDANGVIFPIRSLGRMVRGLRQVVRYSDISEAHFLVNTKGVPLVELRVRSPAGRTRLLRFATSWSSNPDRFIETLSAHVQVSKVVGWEQLWFEWRSKAKRQ